MSELNYTDVDLHELVLLSACELRDLIQDREISCVEVVEAYISQIQQFNPRVNAVVTDNYEKALELARHQDELKNLNRPLSGIPILHKDLLTTAGIRTTYGSTLYKEHVPTNNDYLVDRMQSAGCISLGKTNAPEFGAGSHTFNRVFGITRNPYDVSRTCGGSSGGAAVALATRMTPLADGGDYGGSLRNPAAFCNVIGFRPTNNLLPSNITSDHSRNLSSLGPMARTIDDIYLFFQVLSGAVTNSDIETDLPPLDLEETDIFGNKPLKVAITQDLGILPVEETIKNRISKLESELIKAGVEVEEDCLDLDGARTIFHTLRGLSFLNRWGDLSPKQRVELKPTIHWNIALGESITSEEINEIPVLREQLQLRCEAFFNKYDLLIAPTTQVLPFPVEVEWVREINGQTMQTYIDWMESCSLITATECPSISMPVGFIEGLPVGVQLIGRKGSDETLLRIAKTIEPIVSSASILPSMLCGE